MPPMIAPQRLSRPPSAAADAAKISTRTMTKGSSWRIGSATNTQAPSVPTAAAIAQPNWRVGPTRMPTSWLDSRFDDTARNARPILVLLSSTVSSPTVTTTVITTPTVYQLSVALPIVNALPGRKELGELTGVEAPDDAGERRRTRGTGRA